MLTLDHLISGEVDVPAQKWGWSYFQIIEQRPAQTLDVTVASSRSTSGLPTLAWTGARASFAFNSGLIAVIARGPAAVAVWEEWNGKTAGIAAVVLVGPYAVSGTIVTPDGTLGPALLNHAFPVRDATISRADGKGDMAPIEAERAIVGTSFAQAGAVAG